MHVVDVESFTLPRSPGLGAALAHPRLQQLPSLMKLPLTPSLPLLQSRVRALQRSPHASAAGPAKQVMFGFLSDSLMLLPAMLLPANHDWTMGLSLLSPAAILDTSMVPGAAMLTQQMLLDC